MRETLIEFGAQFLGLAGCCWWLWLGEEIGIKVSNRFACRGFLGIGVGLLALTAVVK